MLISQPEQWHIPRCRPSFLGIVSQLDNNPLPPLLTPKESRLQPRRGYLPPLGLIVSGTAGTGKSYLIHCLRRLLSHRVQVAVPMAVVTFNVERHTLHSFLSLPVKGDFKELQGEQLQQSLADMEYLIIDKMLNEFSRSN